MRPFRGTNVYIYLTADEQTVEFRFRHIFRVHTVLFILISLGTFLPFVYSLLQVNVNVIRQTDLRCKYAMYAFSIRDGNVIFFCEKDNVGYQNGVSFYCPNLSSH